MLLGCSLRAFREQHCTPMDRALQFGMRKPAPRFPRHLTPQTQRLGAFQWAAGLDAARAPCFLQGPS